MCDLNYCYLIVFIVLIVQEIIITVKRVRTFVKIIKRMVFDR